MKTKRVRLARKSLGFDFYRETVGPKLEDWGFLCADATEAFFDVEGATVIDLCWSKAAPSKDWKRYAYLVTRTTWSNVDVETHTKDENVEMDTCTLDGMYDGMPQTLYVWVEVV